jgi:hypothetical protein
MSWRSQALFRTEAAWSLAHDDAQSSSATNVNLKTGLPASSTTSISQSQPGRILWRTSRSRSTHDTEASFHAAARSVNSRPSVLAGLLAVHDDGKVVRG